MAVTAMLNLMTIERGSTTNTQQQIVPIPLLLTQCVPTGTTLYSKAQNSTGWVGGILLANSFVESQTFSLLETLLQHKLRLHFV